MPVVVEGKIAKEFINLTLHTMLHILHTKIKDFPDE